MKMSFLPKYHYALSISAMTSKMRSNQIIVNLSDNVLADIYDIYNEKLSIKIIVRKNIGNYKLFEKALSKKLEIIDCLKIVKIIVKNQKD